MTEGPLIPYNMTGPELTRGGFSQNPTTAPATGLIVEGEPPDDADIE